MQSDLQVRHARLLVVDDDPVVAKGIADRARLVGHTAVVAADPRDALERLEDYAADAVVCAAGPGPGGLAVLESIRRHHADVPVIVMADAPSIETAVRATRAGAFDVVRRPIPGPVLAKLLERALRARERTTIRPATPRATVRPRPLDVEIIGRDPAMRQLLDTAKTVAETRATVLITGESGTGKTLIARVIHRLSARAARPFVEVNCGALPDTLLESELFGHARGAFTGAYHDRVGKFQVADEGTLFLDEIGNASPNLQVKLLRVLQDRAFERVGQHDTVHVDVRVVLATNIDLKTAVARGDFREDLYYRVHVVCLDLPPLRARTADIGPLAAHFLAKYAQEHGKRVAGISEAALRILGGYHWPGNVRELENVIERAVVLTRNPEILPEDLPTALHRREAAPVDEPETGAILPLKDALVQPEKRIIERALEANKWNRQKTAAVLQVNRATLFNKMKKHGLLEP